MTATDGSGTRPSLRRRLLVGLLAYVSLLSIAVAVQGLVVNENAERLVWQALLDDEMDRLQARMERDPAYRWTDTGNLTLYDATRQPFPRALDALGPGLYDDIVVEGRLSVALVRGAPGRRMALALDIESFEEREERMNLAIVASAATLLAILCALTVWSTSRMTRPLSRLARRIGGLRPDLQGQRVEIGPDATAELEIIGNALNDYLARNDRFVERERLFVNMASHELRTPISVIAGATELAARTEGVPEGAHQLLDRIRGSARDVQALISLLLVLAKDPARLRETAQEFTLDRMVATLVEEYRPLADEKHLRIDLQRTDPGHATGPVQIVKAAIGNLIRNAIENSDRGVIRIEVRAPSTVVIQDPGHGMSAEEIARVYSRIARGDGDRGGSGIGLDLIGRLCEHLGWSIAFEQAPQGGTIVTFSIAASGEA